MNRIAFYLYETAQYAEAEPLFLRSTEIRRLALGEQHPDYAASLNNLAELYERWAGTRGRAALPQGDGDSSPALGEQHPDYATSLNNLAVLYDAMGRHARGRAALPQGDGDSSPRPGRAASRLRHLAEQPGGAVPSDGPARARPSRSTSSRRRFVASPWASSIPPTPPR